MADQISNISKGKFVEYAQRINDNDPANSALVYVLLQAAEADDVLRGYDDLGALLLAAGNTEANFTNYARIVQDDTDGITITTDDTNDRQDVDVPNPVWTTAGNGTNNTLAKLVVCYDSDTTTGTDANLIPIGHWDFVQTTNGGDLTGTVDAAGLARAA